MQKKPLFAALLLISAVAFNGCGNASSEPVQAAAAAPKTISLNTVLKTQYFDVTVTGFKVAASIPAVELKAEEGNTFLIIDVTIKNTDTESRMMFDGEIVINANGKDYTFEQAEIVPEDGYNMIMDNINPLVTKKTKLVYKIPTELSGTAYYKPGRSEDDQKILLGQTK